MKRFTKEELTSMNSRLEFSEGPALDLVGGVLVYRFGTKAGKPYTPRPAGTIEECADCGAPIVAGVHQ